MGKQTKIVAFLGGGGKTSCAFLMARTYQKAGKKVLLTTTTHMQHPDLLFVGDMQVILSGKSDDIKTACDKENKIILAGEYYTEDKIKGLSETVFEEVKNYFDVVLVEADGAKKLPLKVPDIYEPVIPKDVTDILIFGGVKALNRPIKDVCHRLELCCKILEKRKEETLQVQDMAKLLKKGYVQPLQKRYADADIQVILGQADCLLDSQYEKVIKELKKELSVPVMVKEKVLYPIILAAGFSKRFDGNKLLYPIDGIPMYQLLVEKLENLSGNYRHIKAPTLVTQYEEIKKQCENITVVWNEESEKGISSSLKKGLKEAQRNAKCAGKNAYQEIYYGFFTADQPYMKKETMEAFVRAFFDSRKGIGAVCDKQGNIGNPVLFSERYAEELLGLTGDVGGKRVLKRHLNDVELFEVPAEELRDCDMREDIR